MTIDLSDNSPRVSYDVADGVTQSSFTVSFEFFDNDDLNVYVDGVLKAITTDYTVAGGDGSTGTITMSVTGASGGSKVVITRSIDLERTTDFPTSGPFNIASLNTELDRFVAISADLKDQADRALQLTDYDAAASLTLPDVDTRKGKTLAFNESTGAVEAGPSISDVQSVSAASADIATLADIEDGTVATDAISDLAAIASDVTTVSGITANIATVAGISSDVTTVAGIDSDVTNVSTNMASVIAAVSSASAAAASATAAAASATAAATSETNAATSETNAATSETNAATSASTASTAATTATTQASAAATSATNASTSETNAATSATNAATSETNAATSATAAAASQTAAAASAASAASAYDSFDDRYLGPKAADPTLDNDGNALVAGALYFNSSANEMRVYDGANWIAASSAGGASLLNYNYTATAGQTTFSGADDNAATLSYTQQNLIVTLNGIVLEDGADYTASNGTSIVLSTGASVGDELNIVAFKSFTTADMVPASTGGTFSGNVAITGSFTSRGIDDNATSTAMTLDSSGNLLVGKTSSSSSVAGFMVEPEGDTYITAEGVEGRTLYLNRLSSDGNIVQLAKDGTTVGSIQSRAGVVSTIILDPRTAGAGFTGAGDGTSNRHIVGTNESGAEVDGGVSLGKAVSRFKDLYLSGGVYLGGTGAANKLDDYEEGTWTPTFGATGSSPSLTYFDQSGSYVKIGDMVYARYYLRVATVASTGSGILNIDNLPFSIKNDTQNGWTGSVGWNGSLSGWGSNPYNLAGIKGTNNAYLHTLNMTTGAIADLNATDLGANCQIEGHIAYQVA